MLQATTLVRPTPTRGALLGSPARQLFASRDVHETCLMVGRVMKPHELRLTGAGQRVEARMYYAALGDVALSRLCHGADVDINPGPLEDFFLVMMPLGGHARVDYGGATVESHPGLATIASPYQPLKMHWSGDCDQLMVRIARSFLERMLAAQRGQPVERPLEFRVGFEWRNSAAWQCVLRF